jgi:hypothetical protein
VTTYSNLPSTVFLALRAISNTLITWPEQRRPAFIPNLFIRGLPNSGLQQTPPALPLGRRS